MIERREVIRREGEDREEGDRVERVEEDRKEVLEEAREERESSDRAEDAAEAERPETKPADE